MTPVVPQHRGAIPGAAWVIAVAVAGLIFLCLSVALFFPDSKAPLWARFMLPLPMAVVAGGYILLIGYIYGDARRRGMRHVLWTLLAALAPSGIGIILYFILREAMPVHCTQCGFSMRPGYAFCPGCGAAISASCLQCHRPSQPGWSHCGWCGAKL